MIKKMNKKSLFKRFLAFTGAIFCTIVCAFSIFNIGDNKSMEVSADSYSDSSVTFEGSDFWLPYDKVYIDYTTVQGYQIIRTYDYSTTDMPSDWLTYMFKVSFTKDVNGNLLFYYPFPSFSDSDGSGNFLYGYPGTFTLLKAKYINVDLINQQYIYFPTYANISIYPVPCIRSYFRYDAQFDYTDVIGVDFYPDEDYNGKYIYVRYFDSNGYNLRIGFYVAEDFNFTYRKYYFTDTVNLTDNQYYQQGYTAGQSSGYNNGYSAGETKGYSDGYSAGQAFGYNSGYDAGLEDSNQYTFLSLVSSVIDAPMLYFTNLFNFELLGVNLQGFLMALFTLCVIVTLVKLCMGG